MARQVANEIEKDAHLCVLLLGDVGTGKSSFASTFPQPMYVFNFDNKMSAYKDTKATFDNFPCEAATWNTVQKEKIAVAKEVKEGNWKTVIIDSTTTLQELALQKAMQLDPKRTPAGGPLWQVHYAMRKNMTENFIRSMLALRQHCNIVFIAHYDKVTDTDGNIVAYEPLLGGQLSTTVPALFDEVYLHTVKQKGGKPLYEISTAPKGLYKAARSGIRGKDSAKPVQFGTTYDELIKAYYN